MFDFTWVGLRGFCSMDANAGEQAAPVRQVSLGLQADA